MKKIQKSSEFLWLLGIIFVALGVSICSKADLGVSMIAAPAFIISEAGATSGLNISVGVSEYVFQGFLLLLLCVTVRKFNWRFLLAFAVAVIYGYVLDLFLLIFSGVIFDAVWLRWIMLIVGDATVALGIACFFRTYLPLQVYELFVSELSSKFKFKISAVKWIFDISLLALSVALALIFFNGIGSLKFSDMLGSSFHNIGLGTIVTTVINSPLIMIMGKALDKIFVPSPLFPRFEKWLKIE